MKELHLLSLMQGEYSCSILANYGAALNSYKFKDQEFVDGYNSWQEIIDQQYKGVVLAPFPNRIAEGKYSFNQATYQLPINREKEGLALHGFLYNKVFNVLEYDQKYAILSYTHKGEEESFPFPFELKISYQLEEHGRLTVTSSVENLGVHPMPFGLGWHPYFKLNSKVDQQSLQMPSCSLLLLDDKLIPTGDEKEYSLGKEWHSLKEQHFDSCFALKDLDESSFILKDDSWELCISSPNSCNFPYFQIYTPKHRNSIAIEPMTCAPNAFNNGSGLILLEPLKPLSFQYSLQGKPSL